jgi:hypothetical protein
VLFFGFAPGLEATRRDLRDCQLIFPDQRHRFGAEASCAAADAFGALAIMWPTGARPCVGLVSSRGEGHDS